MGGYGRRDEETAASATIKDERNEADGRKSRCDVRAGGTTRVRRAASAGRWAFVKQRRVSRVDNSPMGRDDTNDVPSAIRDLRRMRFR